MSVDVMPISAHVLMARKLAPSSFLFALSRGNPAWDSQWATSSPPTPTLEETGVVDLIGYARPTITDYLQPDEAGAIAMSGGGRFSVSATPTRYLRMRLSLPVGSFAGEMLREIGLFGDPVVDPAVPPGQTIVPIAGVTAPGQLFRLHRRAALPLEEGDFFARNFVTRF